MVPAFLLWPILLLLPLCGITTRAINTDAAIAGCAHVRAYIQAAIGKRSATGQPDAIAVTDAADELEDPHTSGRRPVLLATGAPLGTHPRLHRRAHRHAEHGDTEAGWGAALSEDLERLVNSSPIESLCTPSAAAPAPAGARSVAPLVSAASSTISVAAVGRPDLASRGSRHGRVHTRMRDAKHGPSEHAGALAQIADAMSWPRDFASELADDDSVYLAFETLGHVIPTATRQQRLAAWTLNRDGERIDAAWFEPKVGTDAGYYDRDGNALGTMPVPVPCEHVRITSKFSPKRVHPVLRQERPHTGVDFAAVTGTPVIAVADGTVEMAGRNGGSGNVVRLRHDEALRSHYAHLSGFAPGIAKGKKVKRGDVIGYVGSTGLSSGPHLHLGISINGLFVDPLQARVPRSGRLEGDDLAAFRLQLERIDGAYARAGLHESSRSRVAMSTGK